MYQAHSKIMHKQAHLYFEWNRGAEQGKFDESLFEMNLVPRKILKTHTHPHSFKLGSTHQQSGT